MASRDANPSPPCVNSEPGYLYERMADLVAARISSGELAHFEQLPSERELAQEYNVSLGTVRHATQLLRKRGLVVTIRAKGTFVTDPNRHKENQ